ncbi:AfsR/SARP family transcriptional regulator [Streptomyces hiroshimensis]|uniref:SARP family transcriptional regulator n=1 Tax=Streptomyces hiroshimensis TaxID=66424 RepID=A0ABQ2Z5T7_9ACTN|nr:AfsR/SARP family transcriptional regulator [Streptomyces hiroshimensis]GGY05429.1 SARP family transcriptional regulator [Streptomyces hiroshimensis]
MRFRVLGPVRMSPRTPSATKPRAVLATLLVQFNSVVSTHTLIDELWSSDPPRTAATTLQVYVSQLRKALLAHSAEQPLVTSPPGYLIRVAPHELDLVAFEELRAQGREAFARDRYEEASPLLASALELWTGPALSGVPHGPVLESSAIRLDELRTEVLEQRIAADLKLGRHQELIGELLALAHEHPLRETLHCQLMVALYRSGRQSDALQAFQRARRALVEELGVEPGAELTRLQQRVLASDPSLVWRGGASARRAAAASSRPAGPVVWLPPQVADFTGREEELESGERLLLGRAGVASRVLAVSGRPGTGKTALAVRLAHRTAEFFPEGRVLLALRDAGGPAVAPAAAMATLLRRLGPPEEAGGGGAVAVPASEGELSDLLQLRTRGRKLLVVLDDAVSEAQVRPLLGALPDSTVLVTSRQALGALEGVRHLVLAELGQEEAEALLVAAGGPRMAGAPAAVREIAALCGRLPLALRVAAASVAARPHWTAEAFAQRLRDERTRLATLSLGDLNVRGSLLTAYQEVGPGLQRAFRLLSLAPLPDFPLWAAAALLAVDEPAAERDAEALVRAHLLEARRYPDRPAAVRYGHHSLLRTLARELLDQDAPEAVPGATWRLGQELLARARHADALLTPGRDLLARGTEAPAGAGGAVAPLAWFQDEAGAVAETVRRAHALGLWEPAYALASAVGGYFETCALWDDWQSSHDLAVDAARRAAAPHAEAVLVRSLGDLAWQRRQPGRAVDCYRLARMLFEQCGDRTGAARCLSGEADAMLGQGLAAPAERAYAQALTTAIEEGDARGETEALRGLALVSLHRGERAQAAEVLAQSAAAARRLGDRRLRSHVLRLASRAAAPDDQSATVESRPGVWLLNAPPPG